MDSLGELMRSFFDDRIGRVHIAVPAKVASFDRLKQRCSVDPQSFVSFAGEELQLPRLDDVPVCFPRGGGFSMTWPLAVGDAVVVFFADRELDGWRGAGTAIAPSDPRSHSLTDAFAVPLGIWPDAAPSPSTSPTDLVIARDGVGCIAIKPDGTVVVGDVVGGAAAQAIALAPLVQAQLAALGPVLQQISATITLAAAAAADPTGAAAAPATTAAAALTAAISSFIAAWPATTAAVKAKAV